MGGDSVFTAISQKRKYCYLKKKKGVFGAYTKLIIVFLFFFFCIFKKEEEKLFKHKKIPFLEISKINFYCVVDLRRRKIVSFTS